MGDHSIAVFLALTFVLSWWPWLPVFGRIEPPILPLGPMLAALVVVTVVHGRSGLRDLVAATVRWRVPVRWYGVAIGFPLLVAVTAAAVLVLLGAPVSTATLPTGVADVVIEAVAVFLVVGLGEEVGFSAFALPRLLKRRSVVATVLLPGTTRVLWHLPLFVSGETDWSVVLWLVPVQVIFTWIFLRSGGSAFLLVLAHCSQNVLARLFVTGLFSGPYQLQLSWLQAGGMILLAVAILLTAGWELGRADATRSTHPSAP